MVEEVLKTIGCEHVKYHNKGYYTCSNIDGDNTSAVVVYNNEYLMITNYTRNFGDKPDIFDLITYNLIYTNNSKDIGIMDALKYLHKILNLQFDGIRKDVKKVDHLSLFKKVLSNSNHYYDNDIPEEVEEDFDFTKGIIHKKWLSFGITQKTVDKFDIGYSFKMKRVILPLKYWADGRILGFNKRTIVDNHDIFGIRKYLISTDYPKQINLYGLYENKDEIEKDGTVVLFESEKSVLRRDSRFDSTGVALQGHIISKEQVSIICGLDIENVVIALDKDVDINEVRAMCNRFYNKKTVYYIIDNDGILGDKDSPADASDDNYYKLFNSKIKFDINERNKYLQFIRGD